MLGLHIGEAHVLRNAGGRVTDDVLRSLAVSSHALGTRVLLIVQHTRCGLSTTTQDELADLTGADIAFLTISAHASAPTCDVELVFAAPYLAKLETIAGLLYDVESGSHHSRGGSAQCCVVTYSPRVGSHRQDDENRLVTEFGPTRARSFE